MFGSHLSISGGMHNALLEAERLELACVQVFTKNQQWKCKPLEHVGKAEVRLRQDQSRIEKLEPLIDRLEKVENQKVEDVMKVLERPDTDKLSVTGRMDELEIRIDYVARMAQNIRTQTLPWYGTSESDKLMMQAEAQVTKDEKTAMTGQSRCSALTILQRM